MAKFGDVERPPFLFSIICNLRAAVEPSLVAVNFDRTGLRNGITRVRLLCVGGGWGVGASRQLR